MENCGGIIPGGPGGILGGGINGVAGIIGGTKAGGAGGNPGTAGGRVPSLEAYHLRVCVSLNYNTRA